MLWFVIYRAIGSSEMHIFTNHNLWIKIDWWNDQKNKFYVNMWFQLLMLVGFLNVDVTNFMIVIGLSFFRFQVGVRVDNFSCYASPSRKRQTNFITKLCQMIAFLSSLLERVAESNDHNQQHQKISVFHGLTRPNISIQSYLERIFKYANCSPSCFVVAYVYLDRFTQRQPSLPINTFNVHRLLITSVMVAAKFMDDM